MVYSAMKLFMEVNPTLFDECSNQYRDEEDQSYKRQQVRDARWARLKELASERQNPGSSRAPNGDANHRPTAARSPAASDHADPFGNKFHQLRLSDDAGANKTAAR